MGLEKENELDFKQRAGNSPDSTEADETFARDLDRVRILCDRVITQPREGHGCHPM